jgi:hypothetical protein
LDAERRRAEAERARAAREQLTDEKDSLIERIDATAKKVQVLESLDNDSSESCAKFVLARAENGFDQKLTLAGLLTQLSWSRRLLDLRGTRREAANTERQRLLQELRYKIEELELRAHQIDGFLSRLPPSGP